MVSCEGGGGSHARAADSRLLRRLSSTGLQEGTMRGAAPPGAADCALCAAGVRLCRRAQLALCGLLPRKAWLRGSHADF